MKYFCTPSLMQQAVAFEEEPLVTVNESSSSQELLQSVLDGVCDLLSIYDLLSRVDNCSDLYLLLTQNMVDSCTWVSSTSTIIVCAIRIGY